MLSFTQSCFFERCEDNYSCTSDGGVFCDCDLVDNSHKTTQLWSCFLYSCNIQRSQYIFAFIHIVLRLFTMYINVFLHICFLNNTQCTVLLSIPQMHLVACVELRGSWCLWRPWMTIFDHLVKFYKPMFQGIPGGDDEFLESWEPMGFCLAAISYLQWSTSGPQTEAQGVWTDPKISRNEQNVGMAVRFNTPPYSWLTHSGSSIGRCPRSERSSGYTKAGASTSTSTREDLCSFDFASNMKHQASAPLKTNRFPSKIDAWKMTFFLLNWSLFRGICFFWGGRNI